MLLKPCKVTSTCASGNTGLAMWNNHVEVAVVIPLHSPRLHCGTLHQARSLLYAIVCHCVGSRRDCAQFSCCRVTTLSNIEQHSLTLGLLEIITTLTLAMLYIMPETGMRDQIWFERQIYKTVERHR